MHAISSSYPASSCLPVLSRTNTSSLKTVALSSRPQTRSAVSTSLKLACHTLVIEPCSRGQVHCSASSSYSGDKANASPEKGYAFLHDFCLSIPYGLALAATGTVAWFTSSTTTGVALLTAGFLACAFASLSLKCFHADKKSAPFTVATAGVSLTSAVFSWQNIQKGVAKVPSVVSLILSGSMAAFLVYNLVAGGNPPKGEKPLEEAAPHPTS